MLGKSLTVTLLFVATALAGCSGSGSPAKATCEGVTKSGLTLESASDTVVAMSTSKGCLVAELYDAKSPITVQNFKAYVNDGFYKDMVFHRIMKGFVIQGGGFLIDGSQKPTTHPPIKDEAKTNGLKNLKYTLSMARTSDPDSATSQFFVNTVDNPGLDPGGYSPDGYAVFGIVQGGRDAVTALENVPVHACPQTGETSCPDSPAYFWSAKVI